LSETTEPHWLLLIHQIPPKPNYFRVKVWRRLQRLGAVAIKNSVYVLPRSDQAYEDFQWVAREIVEGGGDVSICEARFVEGLSDQQVEALFHSARDADYAQITEEARRVMKEIGSVGKIDPEALVQAEASLARLKRRQSEITSIDFFGAPGREALDGLLGGIEARLIPPARGEEVVPDASGMGKQVRGRTWVTRKGIHIDRMASAWLIRRFIDPDARFKFVVSRGYRPEAGEVRFDMFEAEYTHKGDRCTFEVLVEGFCLRDSALLPIAQIVHDIDLKDSKFELRETAGIDHLVAGIGLAHRDDEERLARGSALFDDLHAYFRRERE